MKKWFYLIIAIPVTIFIVIVFTITFIIDVIIFHINGKISGLSNRLDWLATWYGNNIWYNLK